MNSTRTKIIATVGPASASISTLTRMMQAGMRIARLNFSHGTHEEHAKYIEAIRAAEKRFGKPVAIMQDLQGPKIRIGKLEEPIEVAKSEKVAFVYEFKKKEGDGRLPVTHEYFYKDAKAGHTIFVDDGLIELEVTQVRGKVVYAKVIIGGTVGSHKGINLPDGVVTAPAISQKDHDDLEFGIAHGIDMVALSFVQSKVSVNEAKKAIQVFCKKNRRLPVPVIAKIESSQGLECFEEIADEVDGILIARGDLALEVPFEEVPIIQKEIIEACRRLGIPAIVATQMLHSMTDHPRATRAEISDIANAVFDHADAVMLSQESAIGEYPVASVQTMAKVIEEAEDSHFKEPLFVHAPLSESMSLAIAQSLATMAYHDQIQAIALPASHPNLMIAVAHYRPVCPIFISCTSKQELTHHLLHAAVEPILASDTASTYTSRIHSLLKSKKLLSATCSLATVTAAKPNQFAITIR